MSDEGKFQYIGNDPERWRRKAEALTYNAEVLTQHRLNYEQEQDRYQEEHRLSGVDMMFASLVLWGYAVECFLKCLSLKRGKLQVRNGKFVGRRSHDLIKMANDADFPRSESQQTVLTNLSVVLQWSGRYPMATDPEQTFQSHYWHQPDHDEVLRELVESLRREIVDN